jgi:hypothetical protein
MAHCSGVGATVFTHLMVLKHIHQILAIGSLSAPCIPNGGGMAVVVVSTG